MAALPQRRQERIQDAGLGVALAAVNVVSLLPYRAQLHPLWLALTLVAAQGIPLDLAAVPPGRHGRDHRCRAGRLRQGRIRFRAVPARACDRGLYGDRPLRPVWRWVTLVLVAAGITISMSAPGHSQPYEAIFQALIFVTAWAAGTLSRTKRANLQAAQSRADHAEAELDRQVSRAAAGAHPDRPRAARRGGPSRQPDGGAVRGGGLAAPGQPPRPGGRSRSSGIPPGWP